MKVELMYSCLRVGWLTGERRRVGSRQLRVLCVWSTLVLRQVYGIRWVRAWLRLVASGRVWVPDLRRVRAGCREIRLDVQRKFGHTC